MRGGGPLTRPAASPAATSRRSSWPARSPATRRCWIAAQPTRGLDVGAIEYLHRRLVEERDEGRAILLISLELEEVISLADRILVMYEGEIVGEHRHGRERAGDRPRDARRTPQDGDGGMSARARRLPIPASCRRRTPADDEPALTLASKMWLGQRAGGVAVPLLTARRRLPDRRHRRR